MSRKKEPMLLNMRRSGLNLGFVLQGKKMTGMNVDYQEASAQKEVAQVMGMIDGVLSKPAASRESTFGAILEGIALLDKGIRLPNGKNTTLVDVKSSGLKMGMVLRERRVTGLDIDYQDMLGINEIRELIRVLNGIASGEVYRRVVAPPPVKETAPVPAPKPAPAKKELSPILPLVLPAPKRADAHVESTNPSKTNDEIIAKAVDTSLSILGAEGRKAFLGLLESKYGMKLSDIPARPRGFVGLLKANLGPTADEVEREIVREIRNVAPVRGTTFQEVVDSLKALNSGEPAPSEPEAVAPSQEVPTPAAAPTPVIAPEPVAAPEPIPAPAPVDVPTPQPEETDQATPSPLDGIPTLSLRFNVKGTSQESRSDETQEKRSNKNESG
jgi:hypothetical protein